MTTHSDSLAGIVRVGPFAGYYQRFEELIAESRKMVLYFIHSRRWRENHGAAIKAFLAREGTSLEIFLPDLANHELMFSLSRRFEDGPLTPTLVVDAYRYCARMAREYGKPAESGCSAAIPPTPSTSSISVQSSRSIRTPRERKTYRRLR
jgi:hypothetical protein